MMARSTKGSNQRPDTLMQDRTSPTQRSFLANGGHRRSTDRMDAQRQVGVSPCSEHGVCGRGDVVVIPAGAEHEAWVHEDTEVIDFFAPRVTTSYSAADPPT